MKKTIEEIRQHNLKRLLHTHFEDNIEHLASEIHRGVSTVRKYLSPRLERKISDNIARSIERYLKLDRDYLDSEYHGDRTVYYITLKVSRNFTFDIVKQVKKYPEAVECAAVLGEFDVLIKAEVSGYHALQVFYDKLSRLPGVQRTRTYPAVETIRWQHKQADYCLLQNPNDFTNYAEAYKHQRILEHMEEIRLLENGNIASNDTLQNAVDLTRLMQQVKHEYLAIRLHNETYPNEAAYRKAEQQRIRNGVQVKRIITLPQDYVDEPMQYPQLSKLLETAQQLIEIGSHIRFLYTKDWVASAKSQSPECFAVVDGEYVYLRLGEVSSRLMTRNDDLRSYRRAFQVNWDRAITIESLNSTI